MNNYISEALTKLAIEKGFPMKIPTMANGRFMFTPTIEQVNDWLREGKHVFIWLEYDEKITWWRYHIRGIYENTIPQIDSKYEYERPELSMIKAIDICLNLI